MAARQNSDLQKSLRELIRKTSELFSKNSELCATKQRSRRPLFASRRGATPSCSKR